MPLLLVLFVAAACLPVPWPPPPFDLGPGGSAIATAAMTLFPLVLASWLSLTTIRSVTRTPERRADAVARYARFRRLLGLGNMLAAGIAIVGLGWGFTVWHTFTVEIPSLPRPILAPAAEVLVPGPYFFALFASWVIYFPADRTLHRTAGSDREFWSLPGYVLFHARQFALMIGIPLTLFVTQQTLARVAPEVADSAWFKAGSLLGMVLLFILLPRAVKPLLGLQPLPAGPTRDRLEATARRLNFRYAGLLLWPTRGAVANALVLGIIPWARYVIFTDRLLESMDEYELDAVLGHEVGHAAHGHIPYYAGFLLASAAAGTAATAAIDQVVSLDSWGGWAALPPLGLMAVYLFIVFGTLSRRCERQADVDGCRAGSCDDPQCRGHDPETVLAPAGGPVCPSGVRALVRALDHVAGLNGMDGPPSGGSVTRSFRQRAWAWIKAWQHGPISDRIEFLLQLSEDPSLADKTDRSAFRFRVGLMAVLVTAVAVLGTLVGWRELLRML